jgi:hypothetical protein
MMAIAASGYLLQRPEASMRMPQMSATTARMRPRLMTIVPSLLETQEASAPRVPA